MKSDRKLLHECLDYLVGVCGDDNNHFVSLKNTIKQHLTNTPDSAHPEKRLPPVDGDYSRLVSCSRCSWRGTFNETHEVVQPLDRVAPGEPMPAGQCPRCSGLCHATGRHDLPGWSFGVDNEVMYYVSAVISKFYESDPEWFSHDDREARRIALLAANVFQEQYYDTDWDEKDMTDELVVKFCDVLRERIPLLSDRTLVVNTEDEMRKLLYGELQLNDHDIMQFHGATQAVEVAGDMVKEIMESVLGMSCPKTNKLLIASQDPHAQGAIEAVKNIFARFSTTALEDCITELSDG